MSSKQVVFNSAVAIVTKLKNLDMRTLSFGDLPDSVCMFISKVAHQIQRMLHYYFPSILSQCKPEFTMKSGWTELEAQTKYDEWAEFVKEVSKYQPYKLARIQTVSNVSSDDIIKRIMESVKKIEGPVSYVILKPRRELEELLGRPAPVLWMLGDIHVGRNKCQSGCKVEDGCYSMYAPDERWRTTTFGEEKKFVHGASVKDDKSLQSTFLPHLNKMAKDLRIACDFYMERWIYRTFDTHKNISEAFEEVPLDLLTAVGEEDHNSAIVDTMIEAWPCISKDKRHCHVPELRIHVSDVRQRVLDFNTLYASLREDYKTWSRGCDILFDLDKKPNINKKHTYAACLSIIINRLNLGSRQFAKVYCGDIKDDESPSMKYQKRILHMQSKTAFECMQVPKDLESSMIEYLMNDADEGIDVYAKLITISENEDLEDVYSKIRQYILDALHREKTNVDYENLFGLTGTMDLYFLSRSLKTPLEGLPSQLSCIYAGDSHIYNYIRYLTSCMPYYDIIELKHNKSILDDETILTNRRYINKCIVLTNSIDIQDTFSRLESIASFVLSNKFVDDQDCHSCMSEVCQYRLLLKDSKEHSDIDAYIAKLSWMDFYYNPKAITRKLKEDHKVLSMIPFAGVHVYNTSFLMKDLLKNTHFVSTMIQTKRTFDDQRLKDELESLSDPYIKQNVSLILSHCYVTKRIRPFSYLTKTIKRWHPYK